MPPLSVAAGARAGQGRAAQLRRDQWPMGPATLPGGAVRPMPAAQAGTMAAGPTRALVMNPADLDERAERLLGGSAVGRPGGVAMSPSWPHRRQRRRPGGADCAAPWPTGGWHPGRGWRGAAARPEGGRRPSVDLVADRQSVQPGPLADRGGRRSVLGSSAGTGCSSSAALARRSLGHCRTAGQLGSFSSRGRRGMRLRSGRGSRTALRWLPGGGP
jgi:hypothetical protein